MDASEPLNVFKEYYKLRFSDTAAAQKFADFELKEPKQKCELGETNASVDGDFALISYTRTCENADDAESQGMMRSVLIRQNGAWKVTQYGKECDALFHAFIDDAATGMAKPGQEALQERYWAALDSMRESPDEDANLTMKRRYDIAKGRVTMTDAMGRLDGKKSVSVVFECKEIDGKWHLTDVREEK